MKKIVALLLSVIMLCSSAFAISQVSLSHLNQYITGNYNRISEFVSGYAVVSYAKVGQNWSQSDQKKLVIDKSGKVVMGPILGDKSVQIIDGQSVYIADNEANTSKIVNMQGKTIASFSGRLVFGGKFNKNGLTIMALREGKNDRPVIVNKSGKIIVSQKDVGVLYSGAYDEYFVFINKDGKSASVYKSDGTFSHNITSEYSLYDYEKDKIHIVSDGRRGLMDIHGNIIIYPIYQTIDLISNNRMIISEGGETAFLTDENKHYIKVLNNYEDHSDMYDGKFLIADSTDVYLMNENGDVLRTYPIDNYVSDPRYCMASVMHCGNGVFAIDFSGLREDEHRLLISGKTGEFIGDKYDGDYSIKFNEGYAWVKDLQGDTYIIDMDGNKFCRGYKKLTDVSCNAVVINNANNVPYIINLPQYKATKLIINGKEIILKDNAQKRDGRTFYPFRECMENMGATVSWDGEKQIARGKYNGKTVEFIIGKNYYYIDGVRHTMDTVPYIDKNLGKTFIPVRYAAEAIGYKVDWTAGQIEDTINIHK